MALPTGQFELVVHSWIFKKTNSIIYGRQSVFDAVKSAFTDISCPDPKQLVDIVIGAAEKSGILIPKSWRLEGTYSKTRHRPQTVTSDYEKALIMVAEARAKEAGLSGNSTANILPLDIARDVLSVLPKLQKNGWSVSSLVRLGEDVVFNPDLPIISIATARSQFLKWEEEQSKIIKASGAPKISTKTLISHRLQLEKVVRYFDKKPLHILKSPLIVRGFVEGVDPLPERKEVESEGPSTSWRHHLDAPRPWNKPTQQSVCKALYAMLHWAANPAARVGGLVYLSPVRKEEMWYPEPDDPADCIRNAVTATIHEYRAWLDIAWDTELATQIVLEFGLGLRESEIYASNSYYDFDKGAFWVDKACKTGNRWVPAPMNVRVMLDTLRREGRFSLVWSPKYRALRHRLHLRMGYSGKGRIAKRIRQRFPERTKKIQDKNGKWALVPWGPWVKKCPRHTCGSIFYAAALDNAGSTAGYLGHKESQFLDEYAGKVHTEIFSGSIYRACKAYYQTLPQQLRAKGLRERDMELPDWFILKPDHKAAETRRKIAEMAKVGANIAA